ncbi:MAG: transposase [bacterium]
MLHTWGQTLRHHPHVHCVVPGGGLAPITSAGSPAANASSCRSES